MFHVPARARAGAVLALAAMALAGCSAGNPAPGTASGSDASATSSGAVQAPAATPDAGAYPVTITSALGDVTLEKRPERIVTWGWSAQDAVLALGVVPTAMPQYPYGGDDQGVLPWDVDALEKLGAPTPILIAGTDTGEVPFEAIAAADPDVVLAPYSGLTQEDYDTLSALAPVVAYPKDPWATTWQDLTTITGAALGMPSQAESLVKATNDHIATLAAANPVLEGKTFMYAAANQADVLNVYKDSDPRVQLVEQLGMQLADSVTTLDPGAADETYFYQLSYEKLDQIDADVLIMYFGSQEELDTFLADPRIAAIAQIKDGRFAPIVGESFVMASSAPSVLSIPWMLDQYVPELAQAAQKVS